ncbi:uncharacterized protein CEXT_608261 [Caerostris extrusa]|uniref:Uncharacterized protein n=1 Tax=Caerostris extrusa TaxID=172846 RepID=A0AAV4TBW9_CAEEX|nr:uncharacterized protein CEXT_608261 [Caerostris extrusa]
MNASSFFDKLVLDFPNLSSISLYTEDCSLTSDSENDECTSTVDSANNDTHAKEKEENCKRKIFLFYERLLIDLMIKYSVTFSDVTRSAQHVISNYRQIDNGDLPPEIDYTKKENCLAYLHRYALCHMALVTEAVIDIFESSSSTILTSKLDNRTLNVVFLGGGPGNDFVGFLTALNGRHDRLLDLDVTIVDKTSGWEDIFTETINKLRKDSYQKGGLFLDKVNVIPTFIEADLAKDDEWTEEMKRKLKNADIVFLVKVLSHMPDICKLFVLVNIVGCLKMGALLVYMDYPYPRSVFSFVSSHLKEEYSSWKDRYRLDFQYSGLFGCSNITTCRANVKVFERY